MIIVSQNKKAIINFDNVNELFVDTDGKVLSFDNSYRSGDDYSDILGIYGTEERAKEVLLEIVRKYREYAQISKPTTGIEGIYAIPKIYEMPKE